MNLSFAQCFCCSVVYNDGTQLNPPAPHCERRDEKSLMCLWGCLRRVLQRDDQKSDVLVPTPVFISPGPVGVQGNKIYWRTESYFSVS